MLFFLFFRPGTHGSSDVCSPRMTRRTDETANNVQVIAHTYLHTLGDFLDLDVNRKIEYPNLSPDVFTNSDFRLSNFNKLSAAKTTEEG